MFFIGPFKVIFILLDLLFQRTFDLKGFILKRFVLYFVLLLVSVAFHKVLVVIYRIIHHLIIIYEEGVVFNKKIEKEIKSSDHLCRFDQ